MQTKIGRHLINKHKDIPEVQAYLKTTDPDVLKQKSMRREVCKMLINNSNKVFNEEVINNNLLREQIPVKKCKEELSALSHVVCSFCGGLISKKYFSGHKRTCEKRQSLFKDGEFFKIPTSSLLCPKLDNKYKILKEKVFSKMSKDEIGLIAQTDPLILEFGRRFLKGHMADKQRNYVSNKMRTLADLVVRLKKVDPILIKTLSDCVNPQNFDVLCDVVRKWSVYNEQSGVCSKGSVPRRLSKSLKMCSQVLWSEAIKNRGINVKEQLFDQSMKNLWP